MLETTQGGSFDQLLGWLATLKSDLASHSNGTPKVCIDEMIESQYTGLKKLCYEHIVDIDRLNAKAVDRLEALGIVVAFQDKAALDIVLYTDYGNFTCKSEHYHIERVADVMADAAQ